MHSCSFSKLFFGVLIYLFFLSAFAAELRAVSFDGREYLSLTRIGERFGLEPLRLDSKKFRLKRDRAELDFTDESREIFISGTRLFLGDPIRASKQDFFLSRIDFETTLHPLLDPGSKPPRPLRTIIVDPGHGGSDQGTSNGTLRLLEKDLALQVSQKLVRRLREEGYRVGLTRSGDQYVSLAERSSIANANDADLFISVHFNAVGKPEVEGTETYFLTPRTQRSTSQEKPLSSDAAAHPGNRHDSWNALLAYLIHRELLHDLRTFDRGLKRARFAVLKNVDCPAVLIEAGYLSNLGEARRMQGAEYQERLVESLVSAIGRYRAATGRVSAGD